MSEVLQLAPSVVNISFIEDDNINHGLLYIRGNQAKNERYLKFGALKSDYADLGDVQGIIDEIIESNMHTKFYLDPPKEHGDLEFVHLRCAYNNKYLVAIESVVRQHDKPTHLMGTADEPEEDLSKPPCTLFRVRLLDHQDRQINQSQVCFRTPGGDHSPVGFYYSDDAIYSTVWLNDAARQIILPEYVAFKGDNGFYLRVDENGYLQFSSSDSIETSARFTAFNYPYGRVRIRSIANDKFVSLVSGKRICAEASITAMRSLFYVYKFSDFIALKPVFYEYAEFCMSLNQDNIDWLRCGADSITEKAKLRLEEPVVAREIRDIQFHKIDHSRIHDTTNMTMVTASAVNRTSEKNTVKSTLAITTRESSKWEATSSHKASVSFSAGWSVKVLGVGMEMGLQFGYEFSKSTTWGTSSETEKKQEIEYEVTVPANKKVTLTVTATQAKYDVPFSYTQIDTLPDGEIKRRYYDDGLYSGMNCFDLRYETKEEEIIIKSEEMETPSKKRKEEMSSLRPARRR